MAIKFLIPLREIDAARLLGVCPRTFRRTINRYEEDGLIDKRLARVLHRRAPVDEVMCLVDRYRNRHQSWNVKLTFLRESKFSKAPMHFSTPQVLM